MNIKLILKGFIVGLGKIIPGVSGSILAMTLGIYESLIEAVTNFFSDIKKHSKLLINFSIGLFFSIILFSRFILFLLNNYYLITMCLFLGLIIGTILKFSHELKFNKKNIFLFIISLSLMMLISLLGSSKEYIFKPTLINYLYIGILGIIDAASSIIPGISGTAIFMMLGSYQLVLSILANPFSFLFIIYGIGLIIGIILICYLMYYLFKNKKDETYMLIFSFSVSSILLVFLNISSSLNFGSIIILIVGIILGYILD